MKIIAFSSFLLLCSLCNAQHFGMSQNEAQIIKQAKIIIVETNDPKANKDLLLAVKEFWTYSDIDTIRTYTKSEAKQLTKKKGNNIITLSFIPLTTLIGSSSEGNFKTATSWRFVLSRKKKKLYNHGSPYFNSKKKRLCKEYIYFSISSMNSALHLMDEKKLKRAAKLYNKFKEKQPILATKAIYILKSYNYKNLNEEQLSSYYGTEVQLVEHKKWSKAILERSPGVAYLIKLKMSSAGRLFTIYLVMDAEGGFCYNSSYRYG